MNTKEVYNTESKRNTGRTTRMLIQALKYASEGKKVLVIGANVLHAKNLENLVLYINCFPTKIRFMSLNNALEDRVFNFDGFINGYDEVLFDHYAIESCPAFKRMLKELTRFDA
jgi:hypothetical protein